MQYAETGFNTNHSSNTMGTRYPVGKAKFLGEECSVLIWFSEKSVKSGLGAINSLQISYLGDLDFLEIKEEVVRILDCKLTKDSEHGFEVHIPGTDLVLSVYDDSPGLNGDIFITKYSESEEAPNVNPSTSPKSTTATTPASKPSSEESYNSARHKDSEAWGCAQDIVTNNLKCPSTAKFCSFVDATVTHLGNGEYMVTGWVDAENSFGAKIRENFVVTYTATSSGYKNGYAVFD